MLLSRPDILKAIRERREEKRLSFIPAITDSRIDQVSIDLFLDRQFTRFKPKPGFLGSICMDPSIWESPDIDLWERIQADSYKLDPGRFVLAQTLEIVSIPDNLVGLIEGRSSCARLGVSIHLTAPKIDPGFRGHITLEITNHGELPIELRAGVDKVAQLMFLRLTRPLKKGERYGDLPTDIFQGQTTPIPRRTKKK